MRKAFTLIESLIVVAIVAILAVIAVPNFVGSKTRTDVAQSMANMRAIDTALSAYRVDHQGALPATAQNYWWAQRWQYRVGLTTPVAYMSSVPQDPYFREWGLSVGSALGYGPNYFYEYPLWDHNIIHALLLNPVGSAPGMWGPVASVDRALLQAYVDPAFHRWGYGEAAYMLRGWGRQWNNQTYVIPYDPTNGAVSDGHLFYFH